MENKQLSGIERELVLQYLIDGNVPVTVTPIEKETEKTDKIQPVISQIFPIAIKPEHITVNNKGEIFLENNPSSMNNFIGKKVKVEFYFNRVGLYFISVLNESKKKLKLSIPEVIDRIEDVVEEKEYDFSAFIYHDLKHNKELKITCVPWEQIELFTRPVWKIIPLENQKKAKELLEVFVQEAKVEKNAGNGLHLIPVCDYLTFNLPKKVDAMENRIKPHNVLYVDHQRIVFACEKKECYLNLNEEYGLKLSFSLKKGPVVTRDIYLTFIVNKIYESEDGEKFCFNCAFTSIQEEDLRYLYEKATSSLFI